MLLVAECSNKNLAKLHTIPLDHPFVSVVVCTRGDRASVTRCLESLFAQACKRFEVLLVLNSEPDETFARDVAAYPLRLLVEPRSGVCVARNFAIPKARGEILAFVDDDVMAHVGWLHELLKGFDDPAVACVTGGVVPEGPVPYTVEAAIRYYTSDRALTRWSLDPSDPDCYKKALGDPVGFGCNMAFRKRFLEHFTFFPEDLGAGSVIGGGDECYMFVQVLKHGFRIHHTPSAAVTHFFETEGTKQKTREAQLYAGSLAFILKLFIEEKSLRLSIVNWLISGLRRRLSSILARKTISSEPQELLSATEKLRAYLRGPSVFWKSRRVRNFAHSKSQCLRVHATPPR